MSRRSLSTSLSLALTAAAATTALTGCLEHPVKEVEYDQAIVLDPVTLIEPNRDVDVLFVIDNSGSMAEEQALVAKNFQAFIGELDLVDANYRIGIVTTDNGNPRDPNAVFDAGDLRLSSCLGRVDDGEFVYYDFDAAFACTDHCQLTDADLEIRPTTSDSSDDPDKEAVARPWLERLYSETNLGGGVSIAEAFGCYGPQGVNGAGFESPLEAMYRGLTKSVEPGSDNFGFLRDNAHLAVVFITDEVDCSFNPDFTEIFRDNTTFWSDPDAPIPTSAVCWNAGTTCEGPGPVYAGCEPADYDIAGAAAASADDAVLFPIDRYVDFLEGIREEKARTNADAKVMVAALAGVPQGFADGAAPIPYADSSDPDDQKEYGIGAGCTFNLDDADPTNDSLARPPVRLRELAEAFPIDAQSDYPGLYSICQDDYSPALRDIAEQVKAQFTPGCIAACVKDTRPDIDDFVPNCQVWESNNDGSERNDIAECELKGGAWEDPSGAGLCYALLTDASGVTADAADDMSVDAVTGEALCASHGNVEVMILRTKAPRDGWRVRATCELEADVETYCPNLK
jgi:hypothetical protein